MRAPSSIARRPRVDRKALRQRRRPWVGIGGAEGRLPPRGGPCGVVSQGGCGGGAGQVAADIQLVWDNCDSFNEPGSYISQRGVAAEQMLAEALLAAGLLDPAAGGDGSVFKRRKRKLKRTPKSPEGKRKRESGSGSGGDAVDPAAAHDRPGEAAAAGACSGAGAVVHASIDGTAAGPENGK